MTEFCSLFLLHGAGDALQIQCYQCEEMKHDCSTPEYIVNCTVNVQDMCQKEVLVKPDGKVQFTANMAFTSHFPFCSLQNTLSAAQKPGRFQRNLAQVAVFLRSLDAMQIHSQANYT